MRHCYVISKCRIFNTRKEYLPFKAVYKALDCQIRYCSGRCAATDTNRIVKGTENKRRSSGRCWLFFIYLLMTAKHKYIIYVRNITI
jgi:hypothetical protein